MWVAATLISWLLVSRLLVRPLKRLERAVCRYQPGDAELDLPRKLGPSTEIQELREAFTRAVTRVDESEREMTSALEGQRRLVREVHHRVKNNLQVVASLLNIHGRSADTDAARAAYAGIGRRVGALSIVHRSHFAEMEENRGIALRPLVSELAAELRAGAPEAARELRDRPRAGYGRARPRMSPWRSHSSSPRSSNSRCSTGPLEPIEISLRRASELTAQAHVLQSGTESGGFRDSGKGAIRTDHRWACETTSLHLWTENLAATALICLYFLNRSNRQIRYGRNQKNVCRALGTVREQAALCCLDSDLLPPRSRYPFKWARNRQPSPPPVALPGPLLSGAQQQPRLHGPPSAQRASA